MNNNFIKNELSFLLLKGNAHMTFEEAVSDFPMDKINTIFPKGEYTFYHLLEHIRRTQADILNFIKSKDYKEPHWPDDYWPEKSKRATEDEWENTIGSFLKDREELNNIINDPATDLYAKIAHGTGHTIFREILVVSDHNAYHIGEFAIMRQELEVWGKSHK